MQNNTRQNPERRKICYVTASYPYGPGEAFVGTEINAWDKRGYSVAVVPTYCRGKRGGTVNDDMAVLAYPLLSVAFVGSLLYWLVKAPTASCQVLAGIAKSPRNLLKNMAVAIKAFACSRGLTREDCWHIHAHWGGTSSTMAMVMSRLTGIPWSLTCHRWDIYANNLLALKSRSAVFTRFISERGRAAAINLGVDPDKTTVIHMGVSDIAPVPVKLAPSTLPVIACPANLIEVKGHRYLIEAISLLKKAGKPVSLRIFGDGILRRQLETLCSELDVVDVVIFEGHCPHKALMQTYRDGGVDLVVLPSVEIDEVEHEGVPVSLMEAMGFGIPVVATDTGSIPELLPERLDLTVPQQDAAALAAKIEEILYDVDRYRIVASEVLEVMRSGWSVRDAVDKMEHMIFGADSSTNSTCVTIIQ